MNWWGRFCCRMGWHSPAEKRWVNPASFNGWECYCRRCKDRLIMDSQLNWFSVEKPGTTPQGPPP